MSRARKRRDQVQVSRSHWKVLDPTYQEIQKGEDISEQAKRPVPKAAMTPDTVRASQAPGHKLKVTFQPDFEPSVTQPMPSQSAEADIVKSPTIEKGVWDRMLEPFDPMEDDTTPTVPEPRDGIDQRIPGLDEPDTDLAADSGFGASIVGANNCLAAYSDQLQLEHARHRGYIPNVVLKYSNKFHRTHHAKQWHNTCIEISTDWFDNGTQTLREQDSFECHYACVMDDTRRE